jgi:hypothetical protein
MRRCGEVGQRRMTQIVNTNMILDPPDLKRRVKVVAEPANVTT